MRALLYTVCLAVIVFAAQLALRVSEAGITDSGDLLPRFAAQAER